MIVAKSNGSPKDEKNLLWVSQQLLTDSRVKSKEERAKGSHVRKR